MSSFERVECALQGSIPDMVPVFPRDLTLSLDLTGYTTPEVCMGHYDPVLSSRSILALQRRMGHDAVVGAIHYMGMELPAIGGQLNYPEKGIPTVVKHPLSDPAKVHEAEPLDPESDAPLTQVMESYEIVCDSIGGEVAVIPNVEGPLTKAGLLRGMENLTMDLIEDPSLVSRLVALSNEISTRFVESASERGAGPFAFLASATDNPDIFGEEIFRRYSLSSLPSLVKAFRDDGLSTVFHPHGTFDIARSSLVDEAIVTGISGFQFPEGNDLAIAKERWGKRMCILGGVNAFTTLLMGPPDRIDEDVRCCIKSCSTGGGYIYMCSGSLHRGLPLENLEAMVRSCRRHGHGPGQQV